MADNKEGTASPPDPSPGKAADGQPPRGSEIPAESGTPGRAVPYHAYSRVVQDRTQLKSKLSQAEKRLERYEREGVEPTRTPEEIPEFGDDPVANVAARVKRLERETEESRRTTTETLTEMDTRHGRALAATELQRRYDHARQRHPVLNDERISDMCEEHFWINMENDPSIDPDALIEEMVTRFGEGLPGAPGGPDNKQRDKLKGRGEHRPAAAPRGEAPAPRAEGQPPLAAVRETYFSRAKKLLSANRAKRAEQFEQEERRFDGL